MKECDCSNLDDYLDRDLESDMSVAFERHAETCSSCRESITAFGKINQLICSAVEQSDPSDITIVIPTIPKTGSRYRPLKTMVVLAALCAAGVLLVINLWPRTDSTVLPPPREGIATMPGSNDQTKNIVPLAPSNVIEVEVAVSNKFVAVSEPKLENDPSFTFRWVHTTIE